MDNDKTVGRLKALREWLIQSNPPVVDILIGHHVIRDCPPQVKAILDAIQAALDCIAVNDADGAVARTVEVFDRLAARQAENHRQMLADTHQLDYRLYSPAFRKQQKSVEAMIAKRKEVAAAKAQRARAMYREWYLDVPKRERPKKKTVIADIARRLNEKEFPKSPTTESTIRQLYLKNSGN